MNLALVSHGHHRVFGFTNNIESSTCVSFSSSSYHSTKKSRKGYRTIVAGSPPTEAAVIATEPLTKEDLVSHLASGCKPKQKWRIGTEHEKFGFEFGTLRPMKYEQIAELLHRIADRYGWEKITEQGKIIGLKQGKQNISLEPGGQFELSGAPVETLHQTYSEVNSHLYQVKAISEEMGIGFLGIGFQPKWGIKDIPMMPKGRFEIVRHYFPKVGTLGLDMMFRTCTVQVNLDFSSEADMIRKFRASLALQPEFMAGKLPSLPGELPTLNDWEVHIGTIYPEVRLKKFLEMRGADGGPRGNLCALPALWVGLLYDEVALQNVLDMTADWTFEERQMLRNKVPKTGLKTPFRDGSLKHVAQDVIKLAKDGLERRGYKESGFLNTVAEVATTANQLSLDPRSAAGCCGDGDAGSAATTTEEHRRRRPWRQPRSKCRRGFPPFSSSLATAKSSSFSAALHRRRRRRRRRRNDDDGDGDDEEPPRSWTVWRWLERRRKAETHACTSIAVVADVAGIDAPPPLSLHFRCRRRRRHSTYRRYWIEADFTARLVNMALVSQAGLTVTTNGNHRVFGLTNNIESSSFSSSSYYSTKKPRRGYRIIVAGSPPTETAVIATEPLTKEDLVNHLASGCKPKQNWRIGTEHEKFGFEFGTLRPMKYEQIAELLHSIAERFHWEKIIEEDKIIGLKQGKQGISLEPGGQFELSGAPVETLHQTCAEINSHLYQVKAVAEEMGIGFLGIGFQPKWGIKDIPIMPKGRYEIVRHYMPKVGTLGLDMMFRTCTVQVNLDFSSEADMIRKFRAGLALQPIATALFANSPFTEGKPNGYLSMRSQIWTDTDKNRSGMLPFVFDDSFGFEQYVDYALDVPMYFVYHENKYIDSTGMSFRDFMAGKLPHLPGKFPTLNDWEVHIGTIFPEVRLKKFLEMRGADGGPRGSLCALPAFWVGLLYDDVSLQNVLDITADWTSEERQMLRNQVPKTGLKTPFRDGLLWHVAQDVLKFSKDGLERRGFKESGFLNAVAEVATTGVTSAEKLLEMYHGKWAHSVDHVFEELLY
ncbi:hypothetical protein LWI29_037099 [Acer saccharum]|uniref:Glutamate--cysteine ligase, chloroplastic n=1 Tax=Acer saccharum TaxID=4024 RepID=A0AA39S4H5_ACESA|nr:hypothetical protein LWI29_037099 [Acer saccharum]